MDITSNGPITEGEWGRYEKVMKADREHMISLDHVKRLQKDIEAYRSHISTNVTRTDFRKKLKQWS
jgi:anionic cell wall polymer biosynthesis LytR-Cps2A-Psr (LCP) family protein